LRVQELCQAVSTIGIAGLGQFQGTGRGGFGYGQLCLSQIGGSYGGQRDVDVSKGAIGSLFIAGNQGVSLSDCALGLRGQPSAGEYWRAE